VIGTAPYRLCQPNLLVRASPPARPRPLSKQQPGRNNPAKEDRMKSATASVSTVDTPIGPFTAMVAEDDVLIAAGWTAEVDLLLEPMSPTLRPESYTVRADLGPVTDAICAYHDGQLDAGDEIEVRQRSGDFIQHAWDILRTVQAGKPITYTDYAALAGRPDAVRAAASACARNSVALFVPCHRIVRTDGSLGGFRWGLQIKRWLLDHEDPAAPTLNLA
jgi:methylated-DNA-[protein]-cysteine S-methyltransferase